MTARRNHPAPDDWRAWLEGKGTARRRTELEEHHDTCVRCRREVGTLRVLLRAKQAMKWVAPPERVRKLVERLPDGRLLPDLTAAARPLAWAPADVRGGGMGAAGQTRMVSRVVPEAEVGIMATPPKGDGRWRIQGKVWLRKEKPGDAVRIALIHQEHVIARADLPSGGDFVLDEAVGSGWTLEVHLPDGETLTLEDPKQ
ncbi:MAG: hypothetical protein QF819_01310 [Gemmatimonadota bacterium]|nr:hypothetical protein [Gemmatimonadota bacterium]MDP6529540.1 hypothetical protein [Gemmatimonadota bacterium]MDP6801806.1 hypothetical protein [Gemmatimonadota bacterium]MDP7032555.1 hypothetical protein [Gemmatimonadota bacterium]